MTRILLAGDHFVGNDLLTGSLRARTELPLDLVRLPGRWPYEPFGPVAEVDEASDNEDDLCDAIGGVQVAVTQMAPFTRRVLDRADRLRLIVCCRGGPVNVNVDAATERGIAVANAPGRNAVAAAEHCVALLMAALRRIPYVHNGLVAGQWRSDLYAYEECGLELEGATVGLVGYGAIGRRVARAVRGLGAAVLVHDPYVDPVAVAADGFDAELVELPELLRRSRVVSLHARLTAANRGMIGATELALMPPGGVLVNTARGGLLDYDALCDALASGQLAAAALDVFPQEPVPADSRILHTPNLVVSPHLAGATRQTAQRAAAIAADEVVRYLTGEPLAHQVNPSVRAVHD
ncbi:MAG: 2-hydroxyacid dehydrogenase [Actinocatenispora sp.]